MGRDKKVYSPDKKCPIDIVHILLMTNCFDPKLLHPFSANSIQIFIFESRMQHPGCYYNNTRAGIVAAYFAGQSSADKSICDLSVSTDTVWHGYLQTRMFVSAKLWCWSRRARCCSTFGVNRTKVLVSILAFKLWRHHFKIFVLLAKVATVLFRYTFQIVRRKKSDSKFPVAARRILINCQWIAFWYNLVKV